MAFSATTWANGIRPGLTNCSTFYFRNRAIRPWIAGGPTRWVGRVAFFRNLLNAQKTRSNGGINGYLLQARGPREVFIRRGRGPGALEEVQRVVRRGLRRRGAHGAGKVPHRPCRSPRGTVPVLHRRVHAGLPREGLQQGADDRGGARRIGHKGRGFARPRRADEERGRKDRDVAMEDQTADRAGAFGRWPTR